ncbi:hypothetical protein LTS18_012017 [Coniosporium uncinatum]|uniref:Uncharacterized protein n=1 Tax=Coniosporium uncinatum TaxID=93489 RepID=A0ACC3DVT3_9PEZI|nr:hypothetical protein LTS18_012017 [Coniosporium uncinatum]
MGRLTVSSSTAFAHPAPRIYDFVSNPANWGKTYKGSAGLADSHAHQGLRLPLQIGDTWTEKVCLEHNTYAPTWRLATAVRGRRFTFTQVNRVGEKGDGSGGVEGAFCEIDYLFVERGGAGCHAVYENVDG